MSKNTQEFESLSVEAKVLTGAWWGIMMTGEVTFDRPWIIHPSTRKGLNELVAAGYLTAAPLNRYKDCPWVWKPTDKMKAERPQVSMAFMKANGFPITDETQPKAVVTFATGIAG